MSDLNLAINISAIDSASNILNNVGKAISDLASGNIAGAAMIAGAAVIGIGAASVKMAADFQSGLTSLATGAGESTANLKMVGDGILDLSVKTATSTKQLTDGMYQIESAGYHGADGLKVLQVAAEGAKVGNADLGVTANALTTILTDYHMSADQSAQAMNGLTATVASGKTKLQDLASSMSAVLPLASSLSIRFPQVAGALATMTNAGMSAQHASQNLANAIRSLSAPGATAEKAMKSVGLSAQQLKDALSQDLPTALKLIEDHISNKFPAGSIEATTALKNIMGGATGLNVALMLGGKNLQSFQHNINGIAEAMDTGGNSVTGWNQVQGTFNFKMQQAHEAVNVLMIKLGQHLLPVLTQLASDIVPILNNLQAWGRNTLQLVHFFQQHQDAMNALKAVMIGVAAAILIAVVPAFWAWAVAAGAAALTTLTAAAPFIAIGAVIALVVFGIIEAVQHWGDIVKWLQGVWGAVSSWFMGMLGALGAFFVGVWNGIASFFVGLWSAIVGHAKQGGSAISSWWTGLWNGIVSAAKAAWNFIVQAVRIGITVVLGVLFAPIILIGALFVWLYNHNYYFKALVDSIVSFFKGCVAWIQMAWTATVAWLAALWQQIVSVATTAWNAVSNAITSVVKAVWAWLVMVWTAVSTWLVGAWQAVVKFATNLWNQIAKAVQTAWNAAIGFVTSIWQKISSVFVSAWNTYIAGPLTTLWTNVSNVFSSAWNTYIVKPLTDLWNQVSKWFTDLGTHAENSGKNFIQMLVNGITSGTGAIWNAVVSIANTIWKALGFHSPAKEGPGSDADTWMPNLINMLSSDLTAGIPKIQAAVNAVVQPLTALASPQTATASAGPVAAPQTTTNNGGDIAIHVHLGDSGTSTDAQRRGKDIADVVKKELARHLRQQSIAPRYTSGGTHK